MKIYELPYETKAAFGYTHKVILDHNDLVDTDDAQTINLIPVVAGTVVKAAATNLTAVFDSSDADTITTTVKIGHDDTTADDDAFITSQELNPSGTEVFYKVNPSATPFVFVAGTAASPKYIQAAFACTTGDSLAAHNTGELEIFLDIANVNAL
jgi:hypothetical protein